MKDPTSRKTIEVYEYPVGAFGVVKAVYHNQKISEIRFERNEPSPDLGRSATEIATDNMIFIDALQKALKEAVDDQNTKTTQLSEKRMQAESSSGSDLRTPPVQTPSSQG